MRRTAKLFAAVVGLLVLVLAVGVWMRPLSFYWHYEQLRMYFEGAQSRFAQVDGIRVHYYAMGPESGAPVVLVHGLGGRSEDWVNLAPFLTRAGYRVYLPDLPGYGQSERPEKFSYSVTDEGKVVVDLMDQLGLHQTDLCGWSMGGWIVQRMAAAHPDRIRKLVLFDSAGLDAKPDWDTNLFTPRNAKEIAQLDALLMPNPPEVPGFIARDILRFSNRRAWVIHRALNTMLSGKEVTDQLLPQFKMPVLLVWGSVDHITPLALGEKMHALIPQSQLEVVAGCGHLAPNQCAAQMGPTLVEFLRR
jgi:pimeloyl-ACP methyl ester carboxylesterase